MRLWEQTIVLPESWTCLTIRERVNFASSHKVERFPKLFHSPDKRLVRVHLEDGNAPQCRSRGTQKFLISNSACLNQYQKSIKFCLLTFSLKWNLLLENKTRESLNIQIIPNIDTEWPAKHIIWLFHAGAIHLYFMIIERRRVGQYNYKQSLQISHENKLDGGI